MNEYLSIAAIVRNEAPYLREWIEFHRVQGVEHFYICNNESSDGTAEILDSYQADGIVTSSSWPGERAQAGAVQALLDQNRDKARWLAFLDADEFLWSPLAAELGVANPLAEVLRSYEDYPGVVANWAMFGHSGHETKPEGLVIESYDRRASDEQLVNEHVKCVVNPQQATNFLTSHQFAYSNGTAVSTSFAEVASPFSPVEDDLLRINHYWTKSVEECRVRFARGRVDTGQQRAWEEFERHATVLDEITDRRIMRYVPDVRRALGGSR